jgi:hypothetical protein
MAELEIAKHGKNVVQLAVKKQPSVGRRLREIAIEIATIAFAVSLSIWLHGMSEHYHEQKQVRSFLLGLKSDLQTDIESIKFCAQLYRGFDTNFQYLVSLDPNAAPDAKFDAAYASADINGYFKARNSRYDGFRLGGKLTAIEDEKLLNDILALYQEDFPAIQASQGGWSTRQQKLRGYLDDVLDGDSTAQRYKAMTASRGKRLLKGMMTSPQLYERFDAYVERARRIIKAIDMAYPGESGGGHARRGPGQGRIG